VYVPAFMFTARDNSFPSTPPGLEEAFSQLPPEAFTNLTTSDGCTSKVDSENPISNGVSVKRVADETESVVLSEMDSTTKGGGLGAANGDIGGGSGFGGVMGGEDGRGMQGGEAGGDVAGGWKGGGDAIDGGSDGCGCEDCGDGTGSSGEERGRHGGGVAGGSP